MTDTEIELRNFTILKSALIRYASRCENNGDNTLRTNEIIQHYTMFEPLFTDDHNVDLQFDNWLHNLVTTDYYHVNLFDLQSINQYVNPIFQISPFDMQPDYLYFIDRFQPDYRFDTNRYDQIIQQTDTIIKELDEQIKKG